MKTYRESRFWDRIAKSYAKKPVADRDSYEKKLEVMRGYLEPDMEVLEFGCGTGSTALTLAPCVKHIRATDISANMLEIARGKAEADGIDNVTFEHIAIEDLDVPAGSVDAALGFSILHLLEDREAAIAKVHAMLKPGGVFVSSTVCIADFMNWFRYIAPVGHFLRLLPLVKALSAGEVVKSLTDSGFRIDHEWMQPGGKAIFIVAKKEGRGRGSDGSGQPAKP